MLTIMLCLTTMKIIQNGRDMTKLNRKQKRSIRRQVDIDLGVNAPSSSIHKNKKRYNRNVKHKNKKDDQHDN